jgi:hypothetical protein
MLNKEDINIVFNWTYLEKKKITFNVYQNFSLKINALHICNKLFWC